MATSSALEIERKYDVGSRENVPDLTGLAGVESVTDPSEQRLEATYYDTADLRLRTAGITLRHRTGGRDAGWHLKLPAGADREELAVDGPARRIPEELALLLTARIRGAELRPVARLSTRRSVRSLLGPAGVTLIEIADDRVTGRTGPDGPALVWREWEAELKSGTRAVLDAVQEQLLAAGATPSTSGSKLGRVVAKPELTGPIPWWAAASGGRAIPPAGVVLHAYLSAQVAELLDRDPQVRRNVPDGVHKMRVATRRLRSALTSFRPLFEPESSSQLGGELRWLAGILGAARDAEVMRARLRDLVAAEPADLVLGRVSARIETLMSERERSAQAGLTTALDGERYMKLLNSLDSFLATPPFRAAARNGAPNVFARLLRHTWRRLDRSMAAAERAPRGTGQDELLHRVRKDAKRARYAAEVAGPVFGGPARRFAAAMQDVQESLGDFHDGVVTSEVLRTLGARGHLAGENGFTFGRLHAFEQVRAEQAVERWPQARRAASRRRLRRWLEQ